MMIDVKPGDVLLVRPPDRSLLVRFANWAIALGARLRHEPAEWTHVIIAHHTDAAGVFWGIQGQPGVVGWVDLTQFLADGTRTLTNVAQPKTDAARKVICDALLPTVGVAEYDWAAIGVDAVIATGAIAWADPLWKAVGRWGPTAPGHVVCSSVADWAYEQAGLRAPGAGRFTTPGDWAQFIQRGAW